MLITIFLVIDLLAFIFKNESRKSIETISIGIFPRYGSGIEFREAFDIIRHAASRLKQDHLSGFALILILQKKGNPWLGEAVVIAVALIKRR
jgi:hypothetical protein